MFNLLSSHRPIQIVWRATREPWSAAILFLLAMMVATAGAAEPIQPGKAFVMEFPQLRVDRRGNMAQMRVRIPETYSPDEPVPLFVWLGGGAGSGNYGAGARIADPQRFVLIGLPYPMGANDRHQKTMVGEFRRIWGYHLTMMKTLTERVPNIDLTQVSIGGFSNGAHCIDGYLKMSEPAKLFNAFVIAEGGGYRSGRHASAVRGKRVLVLWGDKSPHRPTGKKLARRLNHAGMNVAAVEMHDTRHAFPITYQEHANEWLLK